MSIIRHGKLADLEEIARIESASYPSGEAASAGRLMNRLKTFPECFWIYEEKGEIKGFICGGCFDTEELTDEMYADASMHRPDGKWQMLYSVVTDPTCRHEGIASKIMEQVISETKERGKKGIILTCKEKLKPFYARFGFQDQGLSHSEHGGATWYQMRLDL